MCCCRLPSSSARVTSERIRDKIAASKRKGLWVGGMAPLGYETKDRKIVVVEEEAERVRTIFRRYLELGSLNLLMADLRERGIVTKVRSLKTGRTVGGIPFTRGPLAHFLRNRFYIGEVAFKGEVLPGEQPAILDRDLFGAVQAKLNEQRNNHTVTRAKSDALLIGRIYDDRGNRMAPSHARKGGVKYRYYLSSPLLHGQPGRVGSVRRVPAAEVEALVGSAVREHLGDPTESEDRDLIRNHVVRVEVQADQLAVELKAEKAPPSDPPNAVDHDRLVLRIPWKKTPMKRRRDIIAPACVSPHDRRPIRAETRATLVALIARGRRWLDEIIAGTVTSVEQIAARDKCSIRQVNMTISLAFLAPDLVKAAVEGRLPRGIGVARLRDAPAEWSRQYAMLGLSISDLARLCPAGISAATKSRTDTQPRRAPSSTAHRLGIGGSDRPRRRRCRRCGSFPACA
jgi:hypothetical protein